MSLDEKFCNVVPSSQSNGEEMLHPKPKTDRLDSNQIGVISKVTKSLPEYSENLKAVNFRHERDGAQPPLKVINVNYTMSL